MWKCKKCGEESEDAFNACRKCSTSREKHKTSHVDRAVRVEDPVPIPRGFRNLKSINAAIRGLHSHFAEDHLKRFSTGIHLKLQTPEFFRDPIIEVQRIARHLADHYVLLMGSIIVTFNGTLQRPGQVELSPANDFFVDLHPDHRQRPADVFAILAHEVTHIFLHRCGLRFPDTAENEILTDTTAAYLGLGVLLLEGFTQDTIHTGNAIKTTTRHFGYLTPDELGYILAKRAAVFGEDSRASIKSPVAKDALATGWRKGTEDTHSPPLTCADIGRKAGYAIRKWIARHALGVVSRMSNTTEEGFGYEFETSKSLSLVFGCPVCAQKLRVPLEPEGKLRKHIVVRCPICKANLECRA